jgi:RNA polymerase sigma-70 factor, ECF subfamily
MAVTSNARVDSSGGIGPELLEACRRGDREAWRELYEAHKDRVYSIAVYYFHGDETAAADATQQVFLKVMNGIGKYRGNAQFSTWLHRIVVNTCIDSSRRRKTSAVMTEDTVLAALVDPRVSHEEAMAGREVARSVQDAIAELPPKLRVAILLRYFDELAYPEMAAALNCSIGTVSSRLSRAHRLLAQRLGSLRALLDPNGTREA